MCGVRGPAYEDMNHLPYLQAVLNEALRLFPSVPIDAKFAANDDTLPDGTFVPRGTVVMYNIYAMGRSCAIWGEDAEVFRPERWLEREAPPDNYSYPVFNAGPRECLGRRLAMVEMKTCLAMLLPQVSFQLAVPAEEICADAQLTIGMGRGLPCFVTRAGEKEDLASCTCSTAESESSSGRARSLSESTTATEYTMADQSDLSDFCGAEQDEQAEGDAKLLSGRSRSRSGSRTPRRSGRARQRESKRRRQATPSPDSIAYGMRCLIA